MPTDLNTLDDWWDEGFDEIRERLAGWARHIAARYGHPVWLVGSVLTSDEPKDIDVRVVLPDEEFEGRWGQWQWKHHKSETGLDAGAKRWAGEMAKQARWVAKNCRLHVDFQVVAESECRGHVGRPKVRLDDAELEISAKDIEFTLKEDHPYEMRPGKPGRWD